MRLGSIELFGLGALSNVKIAFDATEPRALTVLFGGDGVGKTTILSAIASTRPGHAMPIVPRRRAEDEPREIPFVISDWMLGDDDPERPHPLRVVSPNTPRVEGEDGEAALKRREQALFDRRAQEHGGYAFAAFSGARWFSRTPVLLASPERTVLRYDVRAATSFDDATRADLTRETKQVLSFAAIASSLEHGEGDLGELDRALREAAQIVLAPYRADYEGIDARTFEPRFAFEGRDAIFEELPRGARHLLAIMALSIRVLYGASPSSDKPIRQREGVIVVDDLETQQETSLVRHLPALLKIALPRVQWIVSSSSSAITLGCERGEVIALRREPEGRVVVHEGAFAILH